MNRNGKGKKAIYQTPQLKEIKLSLDEMVLAGCKVSGGTDGSHPAGGGCSCTWTICSTPAS